MFSNIWFYYFSSLAQTIAAASALLVALAVIRLQYFTGALQNVERLLSEAFYKVALQDEYRQQAFPSFLSENWSEYFQEIDNLTNINADRFAKEGDYPTSKLYVESLTAQGIIIGNKRNRLHISLAYAFGGTIICIALSILSIPLIRWIKQPVVFYFIWAGSSLILLVLFFLYWRIVLNTITPTATRNINE